jgi:hypothetical protein
MSRAVSASRSIASRKEWSNGPHATPRLRNYSKPNRPTGTYRNATSNSRPSE